MTIFIDNKYTSWYYNIINQAKLRSPNEYTENHHIIPDCFFKNRSRNGPSGWLNGNSESPDNKVELTTKEHYICHLLLTKMITGKPKYQMLQAATAFVKWASKNHQRDIKINSRIYDQLKRARSKALKELWAANEQYRTDALAGLMKLTTDLQHKRKMSDLRTALWADSDYLAKMKSRPRTYKKVSIHGTIYNSLIEAGNAFGITSNCVSKRCTSPRFTDWIYV